jgi:hypothetical protein
MILIKTKENDKMKKKSIIILAVFVLLIAYVPWKMHQAKTHIHDFSRKVSVGMSIETAESLAGQMGLSVKKSLAESGSVGQSKLTVWDGWAFARWFCIVTYEKGKIVKIDVAYLD